MPPAHKTAAALYFFVIFKTQNRIIAKTFGLKNLKSALPHGSSGFERERAARDAD
jgi:hypothetical protein